MTEIDWCTNWPYNLKNKSGWLFCVCRKRNVNNLKRAYQDINFFGKNYEPSIFCDRLTLIAENNELFLDLFQNKNLLNYFKAVEEYIDIIFYTDQATFCKE